MPAGGGFLGRMKIGEIDKNLAVDNSLNLPDVRWFEAWETPFQVCGLIPRSADDAFLRMPRALAAQVNEGVAELCTNTAGGRVRFRTDSRYIAIRAVMPDNETMVHITMLGQSGFDLYRFRNGTDEYCASFMPGNRSHGYNSCRETDGKMHTYTINMPLYDPVEELYIGLAADAQLEAPEPFGFGKPVVYYGSSITQGGCASRPGNAYPAIIGRELNCDHVNLGFSGSARGEQVMAEYAASLDALAFVCDYDHNSPSAEHLAQTHWRFYELYRARRPDVPYVMVSKPNFAAGTEDERRREIILESLSRARAAGDRHVYFVDGEHLFDGRYRDSCTVDGVHPNDLGFARMAAGIGAAVRLAIAERE